MSTTLYRIHGDMRVLLYVGITDDFDKRMHQHSEKRWWPEVRRIETVEYATRPEAATAEAAAIRAEAPLYNRTHNAITVAPRETPRRKLAPTHGTTSGDRWLVTVDEVADYFGLSGRSVRRYISNGTLTGYRVGVKAVRLDMDEVAAALRPIPTVASV